MKKKIIFVFALFLTLTGFRGEERIVERSFAYSRADQGEKPRIVSTLKNITVEEGKTVELQIIMANNDRKVTVTWYKDGKVIKTGEYGSISFNGETGKLTITDVQTNHAGTYKVVVSNEYGQDESSMRLVVTKKEI